jgi:TolA-binding protein
LGKWREAISAFEILLRDHPPYLETPDQPDMSILQVPVHIAQTYQARGEKAEADRHYQRAREYFAGVVKEWPTSVSAQIAQNQIVTTYLQQERWREAVSALETLAAAHADSVDPPEASFAMAVLHSDKLQEPDKALQIYADIAEKYPKSKELSRAHLGMAQIYLQRGDLVTSREEYRRVIAEFPEDAAAGARAQFSLALTYEIEGEWEKALNEFRWIMDNYPSSPEALQVPVHILDHYLQFEEGELASSAYSQALRDYAKFIDKNKDSPQAVAGQWYIAQCHIKMESWQKAVSAFEVLVADYPQSPQAPLSLLTIGEIFEAQLKQPDDALRAYQRLIETYPHGQLSQLAFQRMEKLRQEAQ